jgi:thymidylate synthase
MQDRLLTKEEFLEKLKIDREFNSRYGRKHVTEGKMVLPPCHYGFQVYTRELSLEERNYCWPNKVYRGILSGPMAIPDELEEYKRKFDEEGRPTRAISLMWNQRSVDTPLGLPFNIASYGLLLEIIAKMVNMVPDELIGNLGDTHIYLNQIDGCKEQIGREFSLEERLNMVSNEIRQEFENGKVNLPNFPNTPVWSEEGKMSLLNDFNIPTRTREPFPLPTLRINTEFWPTQSGECGVGELTDNIDFLIKEMRIEDFQIENYQSHPAIKMPLSN